jgi:hypothetical protein
VTGQLHRHDTRHAGPLQAVNGRPSEIVHLAISNSGPSARRPPGAVVTLDRLAVPVEHPLDLLFDFLLDPIGVCTLPVQNIGEGLLFAEREHAGWPFFVWAPPSRISPHMKSICDQRSVSNSLFRQPYSLLHHRQTAHPKGLDHGPIVAPAAGKLRCGQ